MSTAPRRSPSDLFRGEPPRRTPHGAVLLGRPAISADLDSLPPTWRGEIIEGTLYAFPRPSAPHQQAGDSVLEGVRGPFQHGRGGPGGWRILTKPGVKLPGTEEFSPDVAGWRRERLPRLPRKGPIPIAPDWVCEVYSPSTRSYDNVIKRRFSAAIAVSYLWYVDPLDRTLTAAKLFEGRWLELGAWRDDERPRVEPFEHVELDLASWWEGIEDEDASDPSPEPPSTEG